MRRVFRSMLVLAGLALALGACGGDPKPEPKTPPAPKRTPAGNSAQSQRKPAAAADVAVIRGWTDALRHGHLRAATGYFAVPAIVSNGGPPVELKKRADVRFFNRTLPCGATFKSAIDTGHYVVATLVLTERPGAGKCGGGVGSEAYTAFLIERHKIVQWRRVLKPGPESSSTPQPES
jgi:predicted small lipoprotein YifL